MIMRQFILITILLFSWSGVSMARNYIVASPHGDAMATIAVGDSLTLQINYKDRLMLSPSTLSLYLSDGTYCGRSMHVVRTLKKHVIDTIRPSYYHKSSIPTEYNELVLRASVYDLVVRVYDHAVAYRFVYTGKKTIQVINEQASFAFPDEAIGYYPYARAQGTFEEQYHNSFENYYHHVPLSQLPNDQLLISPICVENKCGYRMLLMESDLLNYPGMFFLHNLQRHTLDGHWAPVPDSVVQGGHNMLEGLVRTRHKYIATIAPKEALPWRVFALAEQDKDLADVDIVYQLASPSRIKDTRWIQPGKVAWEWWNDCNLKGVPFRTGVNDSTYQYYIDFASQYGIEYVILDEGWAVNLEADLMQVVPEIHLEHLINYARQRHVKLILWAGYWAFNRDMEKVCQHYAQMGIAGFKVDFINRDDQPMVAFHLRAAQMAAKYNLLIDFHGTYKPAGIQRTYPNVINFEGVNGLEQMKWGKTNDQVTYDVQIPFIRYACGPADYTQGAMRNAIKTNYYPCYTEPMSQGTRCHQLAEYVVFFAPLTMLCDAPTAYMQESECAHAIAAMPTVWDETRVLDGHIGEYIVTARRKGENWYIGVLNNWIAKDISIDLSFLGVPSSIHLDVFKDGVNADKNAQDYVHEKVVLSTPVFNVHLASGGGCLIRVLG